MNNVPADVVRRWARDRVIAVNVGELTTDERQLLAARPGGRDARRDDARQRRRRARGGRHDHQRAASRSSDRSTGGAAPELIDEGYKAAESDARSLLPLRGERGGVAEQWRSRGSRRRTDAAGAGVRHRRGLRRAATTPAPRRSCWRSTSAAARRRGLETDLAELSGLDRYETHHLADRRERGGRPGLLVAARAEAVRPAVHDARRQPREHDLERLSLHARPAATWRSTCSARDRSCASTARWDRTRRRRSRCTSLCSVSRVCSSRPAGGARAPDHRDHRLDDHNFAQYTPEQAAPALATTVSTISRSTTSQALLATAASTPHPRRRSGPARTRRGPRRRCSVRFLHDGSGYPGCALARHTRVGG